MDYETVSGRKRLPYATAVLTALNVMYFFYLLVSGAVGSSEDMINKGALFIYDGVYMGGIHQLFTAMFVHFDIYHLGSNMLVLVILGDLLEVRLGSIRFVIAYLATGAAGNLATIVMYGFWGWTAVSAGASGAVFGLVGVLACLVFRNRGSVPGYSRNRILVMLFLLFYSGFRNAQVNTVAHAAGFLTGILFGFLFSRAWKSRQEHSEDRTFMGS